jgi:hypothetical protein
MALTPTCKLPGKDDAAVLKYWQMQSMMEVITTKEPKRTKPEFFAVAFVDELNAHGMSPSEFSVRGIRSIVTRLFSIAVANVSQGRRPWSKMNALNEQQVLNPTSGRCFVRF